MLEHMCRNQSIFGCCKLLHVLSHRVETLGCREWLLVRLLETECHLLPVPLPVFPGHVTPHETKSSVRYNAIAELSPGMFDKHTSLQYL